MRRPHERTELEPMLPVGKRTRMRPTVGREVAMLKFGLLTLIDPLLRNLERAHPTLPGEPHLGANRTYSTWLLVRLWMVRVLAGWSQRQLFAKLQRRRVRAWLRRFIDLPRRLPSRSHYGRRVRQPDFLAALRLLFEALAVRLARRTPGDLEVLSLDFTDLPVDVKYDPDAAYGYTSKGRFYGYKLHLIVSRRGALLAYRVATANHHGVRLAEEMLPDLAPLARLIQTILGDAGYDSGPLHDQVREVLDATLLAPMNPRRGARRPEASTARGQALALLDTAAGRTLYRQRTIIEQVNGQLKDVLRVGDIPYHVRGEAAVERLVVARLILYNAAILKNVLDHEPHVRRVKVLVA